MEEDTKSKLSSLMAKHQKKAQENEQIQEKYQAENNLFIESFKRLKKDVIRPVMEEMGNAIKKEGHTFLIIEQEKTVDDKGKTEDEKIAMCFMPQKNGIAAASRDRNPSISFIASDYKRKIWIHASDMTPSKGGMAGSIGEYSLEEINRELVEHKILEVFQRVF